MRTLIPITACAVLLILFGCAEPQIKTAPPVSQPKVISPYLSPETVTKGFQIKPEMKGISYEDFNAGALERLKHIVKTEQFFPNRKPKQQLMQKSSVFGNYIGKGSVDLRSKDSPIENQWDGTCTAHGLRNVIDNKGGVQVSTRHIWSAYRQYSCDAAILAWQGKGCITSAKAWPQDVADAPANYLATTNCKVYLKNVTDIGDDIQGMIDALDKGNPVYLGITVTNSMINCDSILTANSHATNGGHALAIVGYHLDHSIVGGGYFIIKNSWDTDCGDSGYQYVPFQYCLRSDMYCMMWSIDNVNNGIPAPTPVPAPVPKKCVKQVRVWYKPWTFKCTKWE